jgi:hypothetical protein
MNHHVAVVQRLMQIGADVNAKSMVRALPTPSLLRSPHPFRHLAAAPRNFPQPAHLQRL